MTFNKLAGRLLTGVVTAAVAVAATWLAVALPARAAQERGRLELDAAQQQLGVIYRGVYSSGGGVNVKMMSHPADGQPTVALREIFSFDRNYAFCIVENNTEAFTMATHAMGEITVPAGSFFMAMEATSIETYTVSTAADGTRSVRMEGGLDCATEVGLASVTVGSRTAAEHATYRIEARDGGDGGGAAGDSFAFTVFFDPEQAPINHGIFGPEATFTGRMVSGEVTIVDPGVPSW